ncbi:protein IcmL (DotI) [Legionella beliardensis]|uniref:Protein IcmL (DotI) n=1 Tax=Legionella beliardensis TaxID=91822 RepID=A0A378I227_9GAMM|nr:DotI/IcmL family type IV secretion protein [Legionella beliardensis]STX28696.1 protein IcmL (DotI) [Legionella beliardensis]
MLKISTSLVLLGITVSGFANDLCSRLANDNKVQSWAYEAILATNNYNFVHSSKEKEAANYFTKSAWASYKKEFNVNNQVKKVQKEKMVVSVGLQNSPLILEKNKNHWKIQLPLILNYQNETTKQTELAGLEVTVVKDKQKEDCLVISSVKKIPLANDSSSS